jgi:sugar-specific transcriptional regulator TrmB
MISASKFYSILNALKRKGFINDYTINLGGRGGMTTFLEITQSGCEDLGMPIKPHLTRGGNVITDIWINKIHEHLREIMPGWKINIEKEIQNKFIDIIAEGIYQPFVLAIELELSEANLKNNVEKDVDKVDFLIETCADENILNKADEITKTLPEEKQKKIGLCLLTQLYRCLKLSKIIDSQILKDRGL